MTLSIIGLGPGDTALVTPQASAALERATHLLGYGPYLARAPARPHQVRHPSDNREELDRARHALLLAADGDEVALLSGGDPGVFAMAAAVFEAVDHGPAHWRALDIQVIPGVSAMLAAAARLGAPLGHDFCAVSLSDNLKPWPTILQRLAAAAGAGFVIALYNPSSKARPWQLPAAFDALRDILPASTPVVFASAVTRPGEKIIQTTLATANPAHATMSTVVLIGTAETRSIPRPGAPPWLYTPRSVR
jgi:precorrin-3B C17-methyltransferase